MDEETQRLSQERERLCKEVALGLYNLRIGKYKKWLSN